MGIKKAGAALVAMALLIGCGEDMADTRSAGALDSATSRSLEELSGARIYFGHQSVGHNILDGLESLAKEAGTPGFRAVEWKPDEPAPAGTLIHSAIGRNKDPKSKCIGFGEALSRLPADSLDVALMKFCYVDFGEGTDVKAVLESYAGTVAGLKAAHPSIVLVHATVPLVAADRPTSLGGKAKALVKKILGKPLYSDYTNAVRNEYNALLRARFAGEPIFDLALVEATRPDGTRETFRWQGKDLDQLVWAYSDDGGHLNPAGGRIAAKALLRTLSEALRRKAEAVAGG